MMLGRKVLQRKKVRKEGKNNSGRKKFGEMKEAVRKKGRMVLGMIVYN